MGIAKLRDPPTPLEPEGARRRRRVKKRKKIKKVIEKLQQINIYIFFQVKNKSASKTCTVTG